MPVSEEGSSVSSQNKLVVSNPSLLAVEAMYSDMLAGFGFRLLDLEA